MNQNNNNNFKKNIASPVQPLVLDEELAFRKDCFYNKAANAKVCLQGGEILKFNKDLLIDKTASAVLDQEFNGVLKASEITDYPDTDYETFKRFLDCIMGFEPYTFDNALQIFQIVWKYQIQNSIDKCMAALKPENLSDSQIRGLLNVASFYGSDCPALLKQTMDFIIFHRSFHKILEHYYDSLDLHSIKILLKSVTSIDSHILEVLLNWGINQIREGSESKIVSSEELRSFLDKNDLLQFFKLEYFETTGTLSQFCRSEIGKDFFSLDQILNHLNDSENLIHGKSMWRTVKKNETISEEIIIPTVEKSLNKTKIQIQKNKVVYYDNVKYRREDIQLFTCNLNFLVLDSSSKILMEDKTQCLWIHSGNENIFHSNCFYYTVFPGSHQSDIFKNCLIDRCVIKLSWTFFQDCRVLLIKRPAEKLNKTEMYFSRAFPVC